MTPAIWVNGNQGLLSAIPTTLDSLMEELDR